MTRTTVSIVVLAAIIAGAFAAHGILARPNIAGAAETVVVSSASEGDDDTSVVEISPSGTGAAGVPVQSTTSAGIAATHEQQLAVADRWGLARINVTSAWSAAGTFVPVLVAVIDTGVDPQAACADRVEIHADLTREGSTSDEHGHGTHMIDTIAAIAPNASFMNLKVADKRGRCDTDTVANAIRWAADRGADVINVSLEVAPSPALDAAVQHAWKKGCVVVAAAGNNGSTEPAFPAAYEEAVAVAGSNESDGLAILSNHGNWVDIAAPGFKIYAEALGGSYDLETGTSPAAAHVSGVAALLCGLATDLDGNGLINDEVRAALEASATPVASSGMGSGILDALAAVKSVI